jgi:REP element-mobilizing transposase RayT
MNDTEDPSRGLFFDLDADVQVTHGNLPHWTQEGKLYFVTWRLADSLPQQLLEELSAERVAWARQNGNRTLSDLSPPEKDEWYRLFHHRVQDWLDSGQGSCVLRYSESQRIVREALHAFNGVRYRLGSFAIAGNHVHLLVAPYPAHSLSRILHSWKSFTAKAINRELGRTGKLWMEEYFDRIVRHAIHLERIEEYILAHKQQGAYVEQIHVVE